MVEGEGITAAIVVFHSTAEWHARGEGGQTVDRDLITRLNLVIISGVCEGQGQHSLLLQIRLVDPGKGSNDDGLPSEMSGLKGSVLTGTSLSVVLIPNHNPANSWREGDKQLTKLFMGYG